MPAPPWILPIAYMQVLIINPKSGRDDAVARTLLEAGHTISEASSSDALDGSKATWPHDLIVLDFDRPGPEGEAELKRIRACAPKARILILFPRSSANQRALALDAGADDCLSRPFDSVELDARVRALLRRRQSDVLRLGGLVWNWQHRQGEVDATPLSLSRYETLLIEALLKSPRQVVSTDLLVRRIEAGGGPRANNRLYVYISRLRKKLASTGLCIHNASGAGYSIDTAAREAPPPC